MKRYSLIPIALLVSLSASATSTHELPPTSPFDFSRPIDQIDVRGYAFTLEVGEQVDFDSSRVKRLIVDEDVVTASEADGRTTLTGARTGKAVVRLIWSNKEVEMTDARTHGVRMFIDTLIVTVK